MGKSIRLPGFRQRGKPSQTDIEVKGGEVYKGFREALRAPDSVYSRSFLAYLTCLGDITKAASTAGVTAVQMAKEVAEGKWELKLQALLEVREKQGQHAFAKQLNRLMNLTQAVRLRTIVDMVMKHITENEAAFRDFLTMPTKAGRSFSARALLELARAMQSAHQVTYLALADQTQERIFDKKNKPEGEEDEAPQLSVFKALTQLAHATQTPISPAALRDDSDGHAGDGEPGRERDGAP